MQTHRSSESLSRRAGFTKVEVLILLGITVVLFTLISPPLTSRHPARRMECRNNQHQVVLSAIMYAAQNGGKLPALHDGRFGWPVHLLPFLDQAPLFRAFDADPNLFDKNPIPTVKVFACPLDTNNAQKPGGLSFAANAGWGRFHADANEAVTERQPHSLDVDWDSDGNVSDDELRWTRSTGVFWRSHPQEPVMTLDEISEGDGQSSTIFIVENVNAQNWMSRKTLDISFVIDLDAIRFEAPSDPLKRLLTKPGGLGAFAIRAEPRALPGHSPVPSSHHKGIVNVAFADGRATMINVNINPRVFLALMTPNGVRLGEPSDLASVE